MKIFAMTISKKSLIGDSEFETFISTPFSLEFDLVISNTFISLSTVVTKGIPHLKAVIPRIPVPHP